MYNDKILKSVAEAVKQVMEAELSSKQKAIAKMSEPKHKIDAGDLSKLRAGHKPVKEAVVKGKGYDKPENERKAPEGHAPMTSLMPGHDERAAKFLARQAKGTLVKGKAGSAPQKEPGMKKEEVEQVDEAQSHQAKTTMKHIKNPTKGEMEASKHMKSGTGGYRDRIAMLKSAEARGGLKKEEVEIAESDDLGPVKKKQKTVMLVHKTSGREKVIVDTPENRKRHAEMGFHPIKEEASQDEFNAEIKKAQDKSQGKAKAEVAKPAVQAVKQESVEELDEAVALSDAKTTAERLVKKTIATHGIANPRTARDHAKNAHAIEKTLDRASVARSPIHLAHAHSDVKSVSAATRRHNVALNMSGAERKAHKTLQAGVVKHLQKHLDQHKQAFQNAAAKYASKNKTNEEYTIEDIENFMQTEEYQQLDELSKNLLSRYKKAAQKDQHDAFDKDNKLGIEHQKVKRLMANTNKGAPGMRGANPISKTNAPAVHKALSKASDEIQKMRDPHQARFAKRRSGMELATKKMGIGAGSRGVVRGTGKLNKEEVELDERTLSSGEMDKREKYVKSMKKGLEGFKQRYGERAKEVMYATATKMAKKD
jgi:hypothetical protein